MQPMAHIDTSQLDGEVSANSAISGEQVFVRKRSTRLTPIAAGEIIMAGRVRPRPFDSNLATKQVQ
jgi:hypothetical protein